MINKEAPYGGLGLSPHFLPMYLHNVKVCFLRSFYSAEVNRVNKSQH